MSNVIKIKPDDIDASTVLSTAVGNVSQIILIGLDNAGDIYFASDLLDKKEIIYRLQQIVHKLYNGDYDA